MNPLLENIDRKTGLIESGKEFYWNIVSGLKPEISIYSRGKKAIESFERNQKSACYSKEVESSNVMSMSMLHVAVHVEMLQYVCSLTVSLGRIILSILSYP